MAPIGTSHGSVVMRLTALVTAAVGNSVIVSVQGALRLGDLSEPQPDLMLLKARDDFYAEVHPTAADVILLIEVADTSARYDREVKMPLYARHGIAEVWLIDLKSRIVHFYRRPEGDHWTDITATQTPGPTPVAALPATIIDLTRVLV